MRKIAEKWLALLMAMLMLLSSMPLTALAEQVYSEGLTITAKEAPEDTDTGAADVGSADVAAALKAAQDAAAQNATSGGYVELYSARVQTPQPIETGAEFTYEIGYALYPAPNYTDSTGTPQAAFSQYEDVTITIKVPAGIVLLDVNGTEYRDTYTISLGDKPIAGGASQTVTVNARMDGNGTVEDGTTFAKLGVDIAANVTVGGQTVEFKYALPDASNNSTVTNKATGEWKVEKTEGTPAVSGDEVTLTWTIKIGKVADKDFTGNESAYNTTGALNFENFSLTDTLPIITGKDGEKYAPLRSSITAAGMTAVEGGAGQTELTTDYHATTDLTAGGVDSETPYYTVYTVKATYDKAAFVLPYGDEEEVTYTNDVEMTYELVGEEAETIEDSVDGAEGIPTDGGTITVFEKLQLGTDGEVVEYTPFYKALFPNGAEFAVYAAKDWNNDTPAEDAKPVATLTVTDTTGATTVTLAPGTYYVVQTSVPAGTETPANEGTFQTVTVPIGGKPTLTFTNLVKNKGILEIDKVNASGAALPGAAFTLTASDGKTTYPLSLDANGHGVIVLPAGTYTLSETTVPDGYVQMADKTITISEGQTNNTYTGNNALVNYSNKGSLTITKKLTDGNYENAQSVDPSGKVSKAFTFNIYRSTSTQVPTDGTPYKEVTIAAGKDSVTVTDLDVVNENGDLYYYTVVEVADDDARFVYDDAQIAFDFKGEGDGVYTTTASATFTNVLLSKLSFKKEEKTLSGNRPMDGVTFEVYAGSVSGDPVDTVTTANGGIATTKPLPIKDASGKYINYYIVETSVSDDYTTVYPDGNANAWGPINLSFAETTDKTSTAIVNKKHETGLTIKKTDQKGTAIANATFTVQNAEDQYAEVSDGAVTWQADKATLTTNASGQIVLSGIPNGTYTVTEVSVPDAYLSTGSVTVGETTTQGTAGQALSGSVTLDTLEQKTITFKNDKKPVLTFTKNVAGNVSGDFTFELYAANEAGTVPTGDKIETITVQDGKSASVTVDAAGAYFLKEASWPAGVIAPTLIHKESSTGVYVDDTGVYYGPYTLSNNNTSTQTITNTPNSGSLTINKLDAKTGAKLTGATFTVSVDTTDWSEDLIKLLPSGFKLVEGETATYAMTTGATNANGQVKVDNLPIYNGDALIEYTVTEATAPENYLVDDEPQTTALNGTAYTASLTFNDPPMAKVVVTKTWYSQWEQDSGNKVDYALAGAKIAIFEEVNGVLVQVGQTQETAADGTTTFAGLDGTKTYYVFELSNPNGLEAAEKELAGSVDNIVGKSAEAALTTYYGAKLELGKETDNQAEAALVNVETYVQLTLEKYYYPEDEDGVDKKPLDYTLLDRAKFHLYYCTLEKYEAANRDIQTLVGSKAGMEAYLYSDYVYESGISNGAGPGMVVTGALPGGYVYWFNEFEAPAGFVTPEWPDGLSVAFVPDEAQGDEVSYMNDNTPSTSMENDPLQGPGTIRYLQVMVDKIARPEKGDGIDLPNTTFELWLTDSTYTKRVVRVAKFTTGVDLPFGEGYDEGQDYMPGRGVSESIQMHKLWADYRDYVIFHEGDTIDGVQHGEYEAYFVLVETEWPANTTPQSYTYPLHILTNSGNDADNTLATLDNTYTNDRDNPIVNTLSQNVTVAFKKVGYSADNTETTWPLAGAEITIYSDAACTQKVASGTTGADGLVYFTLLPTTTYYWKETIVPNGYEAVEVTKHSFTTPDYSNALKGGEDKSTEVKPLVTVENVKYRTLQLAKENENGEQVVATLTIKGKSNSGVTVNETVDTKTEGYAEVELPAGTYTVAETKLEGRDLSKAEQAYFALINDNTTVTFDEDEAVKTLTFENPGRGTLTLNKVDDTNKPMEGVQFQLAFKAFANASDLSATTTPAANTVNGDVKRETGVTVSQQQLTTDDEGKITLENLVPGWYRLTEVENDANENHVLADPVVIKVTASNFGTALGNASATVTNTRMGYLNVEKAWEGGFADSFDASAQKVTFKVYSDETCQNEVESFTVTGTGEGDAVALDPGTYYVKETTTGAWYTNYAVTYAVNVSGRENTSDWLPENGGAVEVVIDANDDANNPVMVSFTNVGYLADLTFDKVDDSEPAQPVADATFALYYGEDDAAKFYNENGTWGVQTAATSYTSDEDGKVTIAGIKLPHDVVTDSDDMSGTFYIQELSAPDNYYADLETATAVTLKPDVHNTDLTGENAIVNEKGVVITLTKYNKPYAVTEGRGTLDGAEFTLYHMSANGKVLETFPAQTTKNGGQVQFVNLPQLKDDEYYAIQETVTPDGYLKDSLELYTVANGTYTPITAENGYFPVATDKDVTLAAYNTPLGKIAILKYDYINTDEKPEGATFTATNGEDSTIFYNGTLRLANGSDEQTLAGGYTLTGDHYVKGDVSYTIAYLTGVAPGTYTVVENTKPTGYLYTPKSDPDDPWHTTQTVKVENDGSTAVVVFANLPDPEDFTVDIKKSAEYLGEGDLLGEEYQTVKFTLSDFTSGTELPLETAVLKDETFSFTGKDGKAVEGVEWYVESVTIGAAHYEDTAYAESASDQTIYATVNVKDANGDWSKHGSYALDSAKTIPFDANACQGIEITYGNADGQLDAGFTAGDVILTVKARQPVDSEATIPVAKIGNTASISMTYDFGTIGAEEDGATKTKSDSASASVEVDKAPALPKASITKSAAVETIDGTPVSGEIVSVGQRLRYTITLTGESDEMMEDPILADALPAGLAVVEDGITAVASNPANLTVGEVRQSGQNITVTTSGHLAKGETLTLTILADVLPTALLDKATLTNTAYAFNGITVPKNVDNVHGSSFTDEAGVLPGVEVPEAFQGVIGEGSGMAISAEVSNNVSSASGTTINKMVKVDGSNWVANEGLLVAEKDGNIYYQVTVSNNGGAKTNLRILDVLPHAGDANGSYWGPTLTGEVKSSHGKVYYSTQSLDEVADTLENAVDDAGNVTGDWTKNASGAKSFLVVIDKLAAGETVTITYTTKAPETPKDEAYYQLAINTAYCTYDFGPSILSSADTKVTIMPDKVSLGDRVWIDENANGIQDETETKVPGGTTTFMLVPSMEGEEGNVLYAQADEEGYYSFSNLNPAAPQGGNAKYFASGDVDYTSLMGNARATYQLQVFAPDGYRITKPSKTTVESRSNTDSDFARTGETIKFYIPAGGRENGMDDTYDVGLIRERDLTITKQGINGLKVAGAQFKIYGPYDVTPTKIKEDKLVDTITTGANGVATFTSTDDTYLNAYAYYVVVETSTPENYDAANLTATGTSAFNPKPAVTGEGIEDGNYFVLAPFKGEGMEGAASDAVSVTNGYEATGELVIKGTKVLTGETLNKDDYSFTITSADDKDFAGETVTNDADGNIAFSTIHYTYADVQYLESDEAASHDHAYHYTVTEVDSKKGGIVYDTIPREITVRLSDNDGDGEITVNVTVKVGEETSTNATGTAQLLFTNAAEGQLSVTKTVDSNVEGDEDKTFTFTVELSNENVAVDGTYKTTITEAGATTSGADLTVAGGKGTFTLKHGQTITIGGIPNGTGYTVTETDARQDGFTTNSVNASGSIATGANAAATFTNTHKVGGLTVEKTIDGNGKDEEKDFTFTVTLEHAELPVNKTYGSVKFTDTTSEEEGAPYTSVATFTLKGGEQKVLTGIPAGTKYTVSEQDYTAEGYVTDIPTNAEGTITEDGNPIVTFKNTRKVGGLTVSKTVDGNDFDANKAFDITVTLTAPANVNLVGSYTGAQSGSINVAATQTGASWTETFSLKHGQSINFTGLPENTTYEVSEADYAAEGYVKTVSGAEEGSIKAEATATVAYTNTRDTGDLVITKTVTGSGGEEDKLFDFTVTLKNATVDLNKTFGDVTFSPVTEGDTHEVQATFTLKHGESKTITGIPVGTEYVVAEADYTADGYTVTKTGDEGAIDKDTPATATFTNTRNVGSLTVTKETTGSGLEEGYPNTHKTYKITVDFTAPTNVTLTGTWTKGEASGTVAATQDFELASDESVVFTGLPEGTTYTITETDYTPDGYEAAVFSPKTGTIPGEEGANSVTATVTNERNTGSLSVEKIVKGTGAQTEKVFTFTLQLTNTGVTLEGTYPADINGTDTTVAVDASGKATLNLKGGETITINGIPDGTTYEVTETVPTADGYTVDKTVEKGNITNGTTAEATFTNTRNVGGLTVTKKTVGNGLDEPGVWKEFDITVTLEAPTGVDLVGTVNGVALPADGTITKGVWSKTFTLKANESVTFTGLPEGTAYTVSEEDYTAQGFITTITPQTGTIEVEDGATEAPTVEVTVTNTRNVGGLTIAKIVTGSGSSASDTFTFRLELENDAVNVDGEYTMTYSDVEQPALLTVTGGEAKITLHGGQTALIEGIPVGTTYTVTELTVAKGDAETGVADENGYVLTTDNGLTGKITSTEDAYQASFTNDRKVGDLTVTKAVAGNGEDAPNALDAFEITVTFTAPTGVTLTGEVNGAPVQASNTITLKDGESVKFTGLPEGTTYEVTEASYAANGYEATFDEYASGSIVARETAPTGIATTVTNTMNVGDLSIAKTVTGTGAETEREFEFTLTLTNEAGVTVDNTYKTSEGTLTVTGGETTFTLKGGETLTIYGIPEGTDYTVAEEDYSANGYAMTSTGEGGEIVAEQTAQAEFTNHRDVGSLKITKEVEGNGEDAPNALTEFDITVTLTAPTGVELVGEWKQGEKSGKVASSNTFTLTDGESVELTGLPEGTTYAVTEASYAANGYEAVIEPADGDITDGASSVTVTNTMNVGDLSIAKTVTGSGAETEREFEFTLTLTNNAGVTVDNTYKTSEGTLTVMGGKATFTLKGGETLSIYGIPEGTDYTVTEKDPAEHGYLITSTSGEEGTIGTGMSSATFTNTRDIGELSIEKKVEGAIGETDKPFEFELTLTPSGNGIGVDGTYDATLYTAGQESTTTVTVASGKATFTLTHDQRLVIHEIPATASYIVRETSYALEGYQTEQSGETGTIPATGSMPVATFTNTRNSGSLIVEKVLAGNASNEDDSFEFTITLSRTDGVDVNKTYQALRNGTEAETVTFTGGKATVTLTGGETLEILDILSETAYTVEEELPEYSDYDLIDASGDTGIIPIDESAQATFTNERDVGTLTLRKSVEGNAGETGRYFTFTVFMRDRYGRNVNGSFPMDGGAGANVTFTDGYATIRLADGDQVIISGILEGTYYTVTEEEADTDGYVTTSSNAAGVIAAGGTAQVSFTNTRNVEEETTSRTVYKVWNDENDAEGLRPDTLMVYLLADGDSVAAAELNEANGWSAVFDDLPVYNADGSQINYTVVEAYTAEYYVRYQYTEAAINITNTHNPDEFTPRDPRDPELLTLIMDNMVPLGGNINMNEGDCFN